MRKTHEEMVSDYGVDYLVDWHTRGLMNGTIIRFGQDLEDNDWRNISLPAFQCYVNGIRIATTDVRSVGRQDPSPIFAQPEPVAKKA